MRKLIKAITLALVGLCMASAQAQTPIGLGGRADATWWRNQQLQNIVTDAEIKAAGVDWPGQRLTLKTPTTSEIPGRTDKLPVTAKIGLSGAAVAKGLAKATAAVALWQTGSELYNIWTDFGLTRASDGSITSGPPVSGSSTWYRTSTSAYGDYGQSFKQTKQEACTDYAIKRAPTRGGSYVVTRFDPSCDVTFPQGSVGGYGYNTSVRCNANGELPVNGVCPTRTGLPLTQAEIETAVANILANEGWPSRLSPAFEDALKLPSVFSDVLAVESEPPTKVKITPSPSLEYDTVTVGDPIQSTTTTTNPDGSTSTATTSTTTTATVNGDKIDYTQQRQTTTTTRDATGVVTGTTSATTSTTATPNTPAAEGEDLECGLPGGPACRIDETGTPELEPSTVKQDVDKVFAPLQACIDDLTACVPELPDLNWTFALPSHCGPIAIPAFAPYLSSINVCQFQGLFHDLMSMIWAAAGLFGAISLVFRDATGS